MNKGRRHDSRTEQRSPLDIKVILEKPSRFGTTPRTASGSLATENSRPPFLIAYSLAPEQVAGDLRQA
jgi:hypothetical protein